MISGFTGWAMVSDPKIVEIQKDLAVFNEKILNRKPDSA